MRSTNASRVKFVRSTVDETLFGERTKAKEPIHVPAFEPPWVDTGKTKPKTPSKPLLFYCPTSSPLRPTSSHSQRTTLRGYKPVHFSPTYVDDSLFGNRRTKRSDSPPPTSDCDPPWVKESEKKRDRPLLFDCNSRPMFDNSTFADELDANSSSRSSSRTRTPQSFRSSSRASSRAQSVGNIPKSNSKPPWR
ncbi:hypothetical protein ACROYT_G032007 [Oculina patagonica]